MFYKRIKKSESYKAIWHVASITFGNPQGFQVIFLWQHACEYDWEFNVENG